jgi:hypothetical protein
MTDVAEVVGRFLAASADPVLLEPGEEPLSITADNFLVTRRNDALQLQAWDQRRNIVRRVDSIHSQGRGRLALRVERFARRTGILSLVDRAVPSNHGLNRVGIRLEFRERFRRFLRREFSAWRIAELTTETDFEHSLSPCYPRALLRQGTLAWAAIGASWDAMNPDAVLTFGLIWLDYLRRREPALAVRGLILYLPSGHARITCLRLLWLNPHAARYRVFTHTRCGDDLPIDLNDCGNLDTHLPPCTRPLPSPLDPVLHHLASAPGVTRIDCPDGVVSLRVRGLEFARARGGRLLAGLETKRVTKVSNQASNLTEVENLAREIARLRSPEACDRLNPLYLRQPEAWLESQVRSHIEDLDASLLPAPIYGQVPAFAGGDRGVLDLLAADRDGRLTVVELKASEDIHLPLQALDYWMRVHWHAARGDFSARGYFPGLQLRNQPPRLLLVSPALDFHPANDCVSRYLSPQIEVERLGVGVEWQQKLKVVSRA